MQDYIKSNIGIINTKFGKRVKIVQPANVYGSDLKDDVFIGPFVEVQSNTIIRERTKIQSHSFICELVEIGCDCFIGHGVMFINDKFSLGKPAGGNEEFWLKTNIGNKVSIGSNSTILPVNVCENTVIGAGSVVTKDIKVAGKYIGNPAKIIEKF